MTVLDQLDGILSRAGMVASVDVRNAELIRNGSHAMYKLPAGIVARIGGRGTAGESKREVEVSRWLARSGMVVTEALPSVMQPVVVDDRPVTWWRLLTAHRSSTPPELGAVLRALHALPVPDFPQLPVTDPFAGLYERIADAVYLDRSDREWLTGHMGMLRDDYDRLSFGMPSHVIHGDAWQGNVVVPTCGIPVLLDFEHVAIGWPDWDLVPLAVDFNDFARIPQADYQAFVAAYGGYDVIKSSHFRTLADIQELRWVCFAIGKGSASIVAREQARHRISCIRGDVPHPWSWTAF